MDLREQTPGDMRSIYQHVFGGGLNGGLQRELSEYMEGTFGDMINKQALLGSSAGEGTINPNSAEGKSATLRALDNYYERTLDRLGYEDEERYLAYRRGETPYPMGSGDEYYRTRAERDRVVPGFSFHRAAQDDRRSRNYDIVTRADPNAELPANLTFSLNNAMKYPPRYRPGDTRHVQIRELPAERQADYDARFVTPWLEEGRDEFMFMPAEYTVDPYNVF